MIELIDVDGNIKFMATIITGIKYGDNLYLLYSINRDKLENNLFVSKLVENSDGYAMDNSFSPDEKEAIDDVIIAILSKESVSTLNEKGISFASDINLSDINRFSVSNCYVTSYKKKMINDVIDYYGFVINNSRPNVIVKEKEVSYFSKNNRPTIYLIILGIVVVILSIIVIVSFMK